jgi:hypothetical protein
MGDEAPEMGAEEPMEMGGEEMAAGAEDEIDLEELLAELDSLDESDELEEAKKKDKEKKDEKKRMMKEDVETAASILGGLAAFGGTAYGLAELIIKTSMNALKDQFKKAGKPVPEDKELRKLAIRASVASLDQATGAGGSGSIKLENEELEEAISTINTLRSELNEVNLLNAKLLYVNKIFKAKNLTESQKVKVIASFDKATNVKEAKVVFESLSTALTTAPKKQIKESLGFASKAAGVAPNKTIVESNDVISRMQKLANIK